MLPLPPPTPAGTDEKIHNFERTLEKTLDQTLKKIQDNQTNKFNRDTKDYQSKTVYRWVKATSQIHVRNRIGSFSSVSSAGDVSDASTSSMMTRSGAGYKRPRKHNFHPYKRNGGRSPDIESNSNKVVTHDLKKIPQHIRGIILLGRRDNDCATYSIFRGLCSNRLTRGLSTILSAAVDGEVITKELAAALVVKEPTISTFYLLPKIHKNICVPPGRPIVSGRGNFLENINKWIDSILQPLVVGLPSFLKDTTQLLRTVDGLFLDPDTLLATADVESLYTNIRHCDGLRAVKFFFETSDYSSGFRAFVLDLLEFTLTLNFFTFKGSLYLQLQGTAMGAAFAPSYANLFLGLWERDLFLSDERPSSVELRSALGAVHRRCLSHLAGFFFIFGFIF
ncbi:unnamed protein product [Ranitomeya imitator]|uniref:Reverse transcriptase n=1 Tax=Ranitomeya imitator TaxID=111125 RepID=A0ABN9LAV1_9NEOB|nr:unnamed protein product [Ranitomeya imitator]